MKSLINSLIFEFFLQFLNLTPFCTFNLLTLFTFFKMSVKPSVPSKSFTTIRYPALPMLASYMLVQIGLGTGFVVASVTHIFIYSSMASEMCQQCTETCVFLATLGTWYFSSSLWIHVCDKSWNLN